MLLVFLDRHAPPSEGRLVHKQCVCVCVCSHNNSPNYMLSGFCMGQNTSTASSLWLTAVQGAAAADMPGTCREKETAHHMCKYTRANNHSLYHFRRSDLMFVANCMATKGKFDLWSSTYMALSHGNQGCPIGTMPP